MILESAWAQSKVQLTQAKLKEVLDYNPATGLFTWKVASSRRVQVGDTVTCRTPQGYIQLIVFYKRYLGHRLAWFYIYGKWPNIVHHRNGIRHDNRLSNLTHMTHKDHLTRHAQERQDWDI